MNKKLIPVILAGSTLLSGCLEESPKEAATPKVTKENAVAVVNGTYISKDSLAQLENEIAQRGHGQSFSKEQLLEELIQRELLVQDAVQKQLDKTPEFAERMESIRKSLLSQTSLQDYMQSNPVTDEELKAEYDAKIGAAGTEYKARHILVKSEDEAKQLIEELNKGADFAELAKTKSTGPSGPQGGDLGWFTSDRMVAPFSEAVIALENGKYSNDPVQTQFGWHVILREDSRAQTPPPFDAVKEQLRPMLQRQKIQDMMANLRNQAKVEILMVEEEKPAAAPEEEAAPPAEEAQPADAGDAEPAAKEAPAAEEPAAEEKPAAEAK